MLKKKVWRLIYPSDQGAKRETLKKGWDHIIAITEDTKYLEEDALYPFNDEIRSEVNGRADEPPFAGGIVTEWPTYGDNILTPGPGPIKRDEGEDPDSADEPDTGCDGLSPFAYQNPDQVETRLSLLQNGSLARKWLFE